MRYARTSQPRPPTALVTKQKTPSRRTLTPSRRHRRGACRCSLYQYGVVIENINLKRCPKDENKLVGGVILLVTNAACSLHPVTRDQKSMRGGFCPAAYISAETSAFIRQTVSTATAGCSCTTAITDGYCSNYSAVSG